MTALKVKQPFKPSGSQLFPQSTPAPPGFVYDPTSGNLVPHATATTTPSTATVKPVSHTDIVAMAKAGKGSGQLVPSASAENVITQLATQPGVVRNDVAAQNLLASSVAFAIPGFGWPLGLAETYKLYGGSAFGDPTSLKGALQDLTYLPFYRGPRSLVRFVKALSKGETTAAALRAAGASFREAGPLSKALEHKLKTGSWTQTAARDNVLKALDTVPISQVKPGDIAAPAAAAARTEGVSAVDQIATPPHIDIPSLSDAGAVHVPDIVAPGGFRAVASSIWTALKDETGSIKLPGAGGSAPRDIPPEHQGQLFDTPQIQHALLPENNGAGVTDHPTILTNAQAKTIAKEIRAAGHQLPPSMNTLPKLTKAVQRLHATAVKGAAYRDWYARAASNARQVSEATGVPIKEVTQLMAVYSQVRNPTENLGIVMKAIKEYQETGRITETKGGGEGSGLFQQQKANGILQGLGWEGRKTNTYWQNQAEHIPELAGEVTNPGGVTVDRHATNLVAPELEGNPGPHYSGIEHTYQAVARELGWTPAEVQAASWVVFKADLLQARFPKWSRARALREAGDAYEQGVAKHVHGIGKQQAIDLESVDKINANLQTAQDILRETDYSGLDQGIADIQTGSGGHTWTANLASDTSTNGYFVSNGKAEITVPKEEATADKVRAYRDTHADALAADPTLRVGAWGTQRDGQDVVVLDLTHHLVDRLSALRTGLRSGQEAIWDVKNGVEIPVVSRSMHETNPGAAYDKLLHDNAVRQGWHKGSKPLTKINRTASEAQLHEWANANPDHPVSGQIQDLYLRAHAAGQADLDAHIGAGAGEIQPKLDANKGSDLSGLPGEVSVPGLGKLSFHSDADLQSVARAFERGDAPRDYIRADPARAERIAKWYDEAIHSPSDPEVAKAYAAFIAETKAQYDALVAAGYKFDFYPEGHDPYPNGPREAVIDASTNKHLYVYPTESGFGDGSSVDHPLLADSGEVWSGKPVTHNDIFRAVHDLFGHVKEGVGFRADGEENAWRQHSAMYSDEARRAMTAETRGQNSWVNFGPHAEKNQTAKQGETVYADQKAVLAPDWVVSEGVSEPKKGLRATLADETGSIDLSKFGSGAKDRRARTAQYGSHRTQFPLSQSIITGEAQRALDTLGEKLSPVVDELRLSDSKTKRIAGKALTPASSRGRVAKQAGKNLRQEVKRAQAALAHHAKRIHSAGHSNIPVLKHGGASFAHWWYAQLPHDLRNAEGLKKIQTKLKGELEYVASGNALRDTEADIDSAMEAQAAAREAGDTAEVFDHMKTISHLRAIKRDFPRKMRDLESNIAKFDRVITNPVEVNHALLASIGALAKDREEILLDAGKLKPEESEHRKGLVSKWLGLEPTGEEIYVGHRQGKVRGGQSSFPGVGLGKPQTPQGVGRSNTTELISSGRARHDIGHVVEDWQAAQSYAMANRMRRELGQLGEPFEGEVPRGYSLINPRGHKVDRKWSIDLQEQADAEGFKPEDVHAQDLVDYMHNIIAEGTADQKRMIKDAMDAGHDKTLRIVPTDVVTKYVGQWKNPQILAGTPGLANAMRIAGKSIDNVNNAIYTALIYANPGYIPANTLQNLIMASMHQGAFLPSNLIRAGEIMTHAPLKLRNQILAEVGEGATVSAASGTGAFRAFAGHVQTVADNPARISAFVHELGRLGVIPKLKPHLSAEDYRAISQFMESPRSRSKLNDAKDRSVQSQVDFERLGPNERALAKKIMFVWGWMRGASRYPGRFALDHPLRTAAAAYIVAGAPGAPQDVQNDIKKSLPTVAGGMPPYLEGALEAGKQTIDGKTYPKVMPTRAISPISTPLEVLSSAMNRPGSQSLGQMFNPGLTAAWDIAHHQSPYGAKESYKKSASEALQRLVPDVALTKDLISPPKPGETMYPGDSSRLGRLERATRVVPIAIDPEKAFRAKVLAGEVDSYHSAVHNLVRDSDQAGMGEPPQPVLEDLSWYTKLSQAARKDVDASGRIDYLKAAQSAAELYAQRYGDDSVIDQVKALATQGQAQTYYQIIGPQLYPAYKQWKSLTDRRLAIVKAQQKAP